jgi:uncharacterized protein (DUF2141 family)
MKRYLAPLTIALLLTTPTADAATCGLTVTFAGLRGTGGTINVFMADNADDFGGHHRGEAFRKVRLPIADESPVWRLTDVPCGDYAIKVFQDLDGDDKIGHNLVGMPTEPYGFSNDVFGMFGPPAWGEAKFVVASPDTRITITLKK